MGKDIRKVIQCGRSVAATLPVEYLRTSGLKLGDEIELIYDGSVLQISPLDNSEIKRRLAGAGA